MIDLREATLEELLSEPIIQKVMASDGVRADDIRQLMKQVSTRTRCQRDISRPIRAAAALFTADRHISKALGSPVA